MASRKEEKERLRQQRLAAEQAEKAQQRRRLVIGYVSAGILAALVEIKYAYHVGIEYEKDADDPLPGLAETVGYIRGSLAAIE